MGIRMALPAVGYGGEGESEGRGLGAKEGGGVARKRSGSGGSDSRRVGEKGSKGARGARETGSKGSKGRKGSKGEGERNDRSKGKRGCMRVGESVCRRVHEWESWGEGEFGIVGMGRRRAAVCENQERDKEMRRGGGEEATTSANPTGAGKQSLRTQRADGVGTNRRADVAQMENDCRQRDQ
jgi:hypothetical protein